MPDQLSAAPFLKSIYRTLFLLIILLSAADIALAQTMAFKHIKNYQEYYGWAHAEPQDRIILRKFENDHKTYYLMVNPQTLETEVNDSDIYKIKVLGMPDARLLFKNTAYMRALAKAAKQSIATQDAGIQQGMPKEAGISLTADLCPSHKPLDKIIFTDIFNEFGKVERPVPIALSVTGIWMRQHPQDLEWLKQMETKREIRVTWINHSYNHRVSARAPLKENFLLEPGTNISYEVLATEQAMLQNGLMPSIFFRFPGLVSDQQLVTKITDYGLIPVGTDAWLAKGQQPQAGSIVLIHGNGNEPVGVRDFIQLLKSKTKSIADKQWLLYDLRESVDEEFSEGK